MKIAIFASIGSQNLWDELILKNEIKILEKKYSEKFNISKKYIEFNVFTYDLQNNFCNAENIKYIEYFPINIKKITNVFRNIRNFFNLLKVVLISDLIVVWWGWIIYDNELQSVWNPLRQWEFRSIIFKFFRKKVEFFRVWINVKNKDNYFSLKSIFSCAEKISVRDNYSFSLLWKLGFWEKLELLQDPVFLDDKNFSERKMSFSKRKKENKNCDFLKWNLDILDLNVQNIINIIINNNLNIKWKKIWLALRWQKIENYEKNILEIIKYFLENKAEIILIPHSFHKTDELANDFIFLNSINRILSTEGFSPLYICKTMEESYEIYTNKKIDLNLASRLHSIILSQVYEIDFIAVSYSTKTDEVIKMLNKKTES